MSKLKKLLSLFVIFLSTVFLSACSSLLGPQKAGIQVISAQMESSIFLNDQYIDKTPFINKELKPGEYILKIQPDDSEYASYETKIILQKGLLTVVTWKPGTRPEFSGGVVYEMEKSENKNESQLSLISIPDRAIVSIDGEDKDFAPLLVEDITPGHHEFEVSLPSYQTQKHTINVLEGYRMLVSVKLAKQNYTEDVLGDEEEATQSAELELDAEASESSKTTKTSKKKIIKKIDITGPRVLVKSTGFLVDGEEVLRVRDKVGTGKEIGFAKVGEEYQYLEESRSGWHKIEFESQEAWVSGKYVELIEE